MQPHARIAIVISLVAALLPATASAQYSSRVFELKKLGESYDERGFEEGRALTLDGRLAVSGSNGNVSYTYPISSTSVSGYPLTVNLNYCGSVSFTTYNDWVDGTGSPFSRWNRFSQNRPAWILGVNGFAIQVLSTATTYHNEPGAFPDSRNAFTDADFVWTIDGYDVCNRMDRIISTTGSTSRYVDVIRLLREDGSLLELVNPKQRDPARPELTRADLYTGHYVVNEANSRGYALVELDSTYWPDYMRRMPLPTGFTGPQYPFIPRVVRYYPGDGTELIFREWLIPFGAQPRSGQGLDRPDRFGGAWGSPTIFYLEEITSSGGTITRFERSRHYWPREQVTTIDGNVFDPRFESVLDSSRGRALITSFRGHRIDYGDGGLVIEALGRTTKVKIDSVLTSGEAATSGPMPLATRGYFTSSTAALAAVAETGGSSVSIRGSWLGYVTEIVDPGGRRTRFEYQPYRRRYINYGFPHANPPGGNDQTLTLRNLRLRRVIEPSSSWRVTYATSSPLGEPVGDPDILPVDTVVRYGMETGEHPYRLQNVARRLRRYDAAGRLLTTTDYAFSYDLGQGGFVQGVETTRDGIDSAVTVTTALFRRRLLPDTVPWFPEPRYTELYSLTRAGADTVVTTTTFDSVSPGAAVWMPVREVKSVNGVVQSDLRFAYQFDTLRTYGGDRTLSGRYGLEVRRRITQRRSPLTAALLRLDTAEYLNLPTVDTTLVRLDSSLLKYRTLERYLELRRAGTVTSTWEEAMYDPSIAIYRIDSTPQRTTLPAQYGLEERAWSSSPDGALRSGVARRFSNGVGATLSDRLYRGSPIGDSLIGSPGSATLLRESVEFTRQWSLNLPMRRMSANGGGERRYYESYSSPSLREPDGGYRARGRVTRNDDRSADSLLAQPGYFARLFQRPSIIEQYIRRPDSLGKRWYVDTLRRLYEYSFFGQSSQMVDENGHLSSFAYDRDGRLVRAWLPRDYPSQAREVVTEGRRSIALIGTTNRSFRVDTLRCDVGTSSWITGRSASTTLRNLYAELPTTDPQPACPCVGRNDEGKGGTLLATCRSDRYWLAEDRYIGRLVVTIDPSSPLTRIDRLDGAWLQLHVTHVAGSCVGVTVRSPQISFSRSLLLDCPEDRVQNRAGEQRKGGELQGEESSRPAPSANPYTLQVDLTDALAQLRSVPVGSELAFEIEVTSPGAAVEIVSGADAEDTRPRLVLEGAFRTSGNADDDFTLAYQHDDTARRTVVHAKLDDSRHSESPLDPSDQNPPVVRRSEAWHELGPDGEPHRSHAAWLDGETLRRGDTTASRTNGRGLPLMQRTEEGDSVLITYDADGRATSERYVDGSIVRYGYMVAAPERLGIGDQELDGFCFRRCRVDENGIVTAEYRDAEDRLRREVVDTAGLRLTTRYEYDRLGRLSLVINPAGDTMSHHYDSWGRLSRRRSTDGGTTSYAYDRVGNMRFSQSQEQAVAGRLTFNQYDDLNRLTLVGEAQFGNSDHGDGGGGVNPVTRKGGAGGLLALPGGNRLTDICDPQRLHDGGAGGLLTANLSLHATPTRLVPTIWGMPSLRSLLCSLPPSQLLGESSPTTRFVLRHPVVFHEPVMTPAATLNDFENVAGYPHFVRKVVSYDRLPARSGAVWGAFPSHGRWDSLSPTGRVRNGKGREVAIAYRDHGGEPFHYVVMSYDERGRVEALMRFTENLGFDAVYYRYNSANQVVEIRTADPLATHRTWYGFDGRGRVDSIWTRLDQKGLAPGAMRFDQQRYPSIVTTRPDSAAITYDYHPGGRVATARYPRIGAETSFRFAPRRRLDSIVVRGRGGQQLMAEHLGYDRAGRVTLRTTSRGLSFRSEPMYYDRAGRLTDFGSTTSLNMTSYAYDAVGNRTNAWEPSPFGGVVASRYDYPTTGEGRNRLASVQQTDPNGALLNRTTFAYDADGAVTSRRVYDATGAPVAGIDLAYSYRELTRQIVTMPGTPQQMDWRYRHGPQGGREQKRLYAAPQPDNVATHPWSYALRGANGEELARFHGQQSSGAACAEPGRWVYLYPAEYYTYGAGTSADVSTKPDGSLEYRIHDHLGSVRLILDSLGVVTRTADYDPFGIERGGATTGRGFIDRERDAESGLHDFGVRRFDAVTGRFLSPDPAWVEFESLTPYQYGQNDPMRRVDPSGLWDIIVAAEKSSGKKGMATAYLVDRNGNVVYTFQVRTQGQHRNRMRTNGDTPFGTYDIHDRGAWRSGGSRRAYGPHPRLVITPESGEARRSGRSAIRLHGGRQEDLRRDGKTGRSRWVPNGKQLEQLPPTHGCLRALDDVMRTLREKTKELERDDPAEKPGKLKVVTPEEAARLLQGGSGDAKVDGK